MGEGKISIDTTDEAMHTVHTTVASKLTQQAIKDLVDGNVDAAAELYVDAAYHTRQAVGYFKRMVYEALNPESEEC